MSREQLDRLLKIWPYLSKHQKKRLANGIRWKLLLLNFPLMFVGYQAGGLLLLMYFLEIEIFMIFVAVYGGSLALVLNGVMVRRLVRVWRRG